MAQTILYVSHVAAAGGAERSLADLVRGLDPARFKAVVAMPSGGRLQARLGNVRVCPLPLVRMRRTRNPFRLTRYAVSLLRIGIVLGRLARRHGAVLIHANSTTAQLYARVASIYAGIPTVWHCRDLVPLGRLVRPLTSGRTHVVAISDAVAGHLRSAGVPPAKLSRVYNGIAVAPATDRGRFRRELGIAEAGVLYGMVGQLVPWKRHDLFLGAARQIAERQPEARFAVIGVDWFDDHPHYRRRLRETAAQGVLAGRVHFCGFRENMPTVLGDLDVLVHPAEREPFGRVIAEAMALGRPVVAVNACGPAELIRDEVEGLLVAPGSVTELANAALRVACDPELATRLGRAAQRRIERDFALSAFVRRMERVYESATGAG